MKKKKEIPESVKKGLKVFRIIKNVILSVVLVVLVCVLILTLMARISGETPTFFGHTVYRVSSASMVPYLEVGDIILSRECDPMTLKEGDVITFNGSHGQYEGKRITHRVVKAPYLDIADDQYYLVTKGDDNPVEDSPILISQVTGVMVGKAALIRKLYDFFITPWGLLTILLLIILAFFNEFINLGKAILGYGGEKKEEDIQEVIDRIQREDREKEGLDAESRKHLKARHMKHSEKDSEKTNN